MMHEKTESLVMGREKASSLQLPIPVPHRTSLRSSATTRKYLSVLVGSDQDSERTLSRPSMIVRKYRLIMALSEL